MIRVDVSLPDAAAALGSGAFGTGALVRLERATDPASTFSEITTIAIVSGTSTYTYWDTNGSATSWYQWRPSDSGNTKQGDYSSPFQGTSQASPTAYGSLARLLRMWQQPPSSVAQLARLSDLLGVANAQLIEACGHRDFFRHPSTGTATWLVNGDGMDTIHVHEGLVSLSLLELSFDFGKTFLPVTSTDYMLLGDSPYSQEPPTAGEPYFHIRFTGYGQYVNIPPTVQAARLTGARGWATPPTVLIEAEAQRARQLFFGDSLINVQGLPSDGGSPMGQFGQSIDRFWPQALYNFLQAEHSRFLGCHVGRTGEMPTGIWTGTR